MRPKTLWFSCITLALSFVLTGCSTLQVSGTSLAQQTVNNYNLLVAHTLADYAQAKLVADQGKSALFAFLTSDTPSPLVKSVSHQLPALTPSQLRSFKQSSVAFDNYFTALGATGVREVTIIDSPSYKLYATTLWNAKGLYALNRTVVPLR